MSTTNGNGTRTVDPPEGAVPRVGVQAATRRSAALGDEAQTELATIRKRIVQLDTELDTLYAEQTRLTRIAKASGVIYQEDA